MFSTSPFLCKARVIMGLLSSIYTTSVLKIFFTVFFALFTSSPSEHIFVAADISAKSPGASWAHVQWPTTSRPPSVASWIWRPLPPPPPPTLRPARANFLQFPECVYDVSGNISDLPELGLDYEVELEGTDLNSNLTFKSAIFADGSRQLGVVAMDFLDHQELFLYNLKTGQSFRAEGLWNISTSNFCQVNFFIVQTYPMTNVIVAHNFFEIKIFTHAVKFILYVFPLQKTNVSHSHLLRAIPLPIFCCAARTNPRL